MKLLATLALLIAFALPAAADEVLSSEAAREKALTGEIVLIDIRTPGEWAETGLPDVAHAIDLQGDKFVVKLKRLMDDNAGKPVAMICATGARSSYVAEALKQRGITILNVREGMLGSPDGPGWLKKGCRSGRLESRPSNDRHQCARVLTGTSILPVAGYRDRAMGTFGVAAESQDHAVPGLAVVAAGHIGA